MIQLKVEGLKEYREALKEFSDRRLNAVIATALTRTAVQVKNAAQRAAETQLKAPTPYTLRQLRYVAATAARPVAAVGFNIAPIQDERGNVVRYQDLGSGETPAGKYLQFQTEGGQRAVKRFEKALRAVGVLPAGWLAVPGEKAKMTPFGNQSVGEMRQILSYFDAAELVAGSRQNMGAAGRAKRLKGTRKTAGWEYFVVKQGDRRRFIRANGWKGSHGMQPGIYRRTYLAMGTRIEPVVIFVRAATYRARYDFYGVTKREGDSQLPIEMLRGIQEQLDRLRLRNGGGA